MPKTQNTPVLGASPPPTATPRPTPTPAATTTAVVGTSPANPVYTKQITGPVSGGLALALTVGAALIGSFGGQLVSHLLTRARDRRATERDGAERCIREAVEVGHLMEVYLGSTVHRQLELNDEIAYHLRLLMATTMGYSIRGGHDRVLVQQFGTLIDIAKEFVRVINTGHRRGLEEIATDFTYRLNLIGIAANSALVIDPDPTL